jgi:hypothetical protein
MRLINTVYLVILFATLTNLAYGAEVGPITMRDDANITLQNGFLTGAGGITFNGSAPTETSGVLYSDAGTLKFNGDEIGGGTEVGGWTDAGETWYYSAADDPSFKINISGDLTKKYYPGQRINLTQTSIKYFLVTKVTYASPNTTITLYGGTDYDLANAAITTPYFSTGYAPFGFPLSPGKWSVETIDTSIRARATPTASTWNNPGSLTLVVPPGMWDISVYALCYVGDSPATTVSVYGALSTSTSAVSDTELEAMSYAQALVDLFVPLQREHRGVSLSAKTTYNLIIQTINSGMTTIDLRGNVIPTVLRATSSYL